MAWVDRDHVLNLQVVQGHQQLRPWKGVIFTELRPRKILATARKGESFKAEPLEPLSKGHQPNRFYSTPEKKSHQHATRYSSYVGLLFTFILVPKCTVMHILCPQEQSPQKLEGHVVELDVGANHLGQLLDDLRLAPALGRTVKETGSRLVCEQDVLLVFDVLKPHAI